MGFESTTNALEKIAAGVIHGATAVNINGYNGAVTTTYETVWDESSAYSFLTAAMSSPYVSSGSANDASAGTGARTVRLYGVDTSFAAFTEDVTMNGQTSVVLTTSNILAINKIEVLTAGSGGVNAGVIYVGTGTNTSGVPAVKHAHMAVGTNVTRHGFYVVPADHQLLVKGIHAASASTTAGALSVAIKQIVGLAGLVKEVSTWRAMNTDCLNLEFAIPLKFAATSQLNFQLLSSAGTGPASFFANCVLINQTKGTAAAPQPSRWI